MEDRDLVQLGKLMDGAQEMDSMVLYHGNILDHKIFFQIPQVDLHREGKEKRPS